MDELSGPWASDLPSVDRLHEPRNTRLRTTKLLRLRLVLLIRLVCTSGAMALKNGAEAAARAKPVIKKDATGVSGAFSHHVGMIQFRSMTFRPLCALDVHT